MCEAHDILTGGVEISRFLRGSQTGLNHGRLTRQDLDIRGRMTTCACRQIHVSPWRHCISSCDAPYLARPSSLCARAHVCFGPLYETHHAPMSLAPYERSRLPIPARCARVRGRWKEDHTELCSHTHVYTPVVKSLQVQREHRHPKHWCTCEVLGIPSNPRRVESEL